MNRSSKTILVAVTLMLLCFASAAWACPTCKDAMAGDPANSNMVQGYFWSIIFMMSMPFLVFSGVAAYFYSEVRRARVRQAATISPESASNAAATPEVSLQS